MSMHLLPAYFTTTKTSKKSKQKSPAQLKHEKWLASKKLTLSDIETKKTVDLNWKKQYTNDIKVERGNYVSAGMSGTKDACAKRDIMTNLHKEPEHVRKEIMAKASRVMPAYSKGGLQYISSDADYKYAGKKI
jgi:hypothetical protein